MGLLKQRLRPEVVNFLKITKPIGGTPASYALAA